MSPDQKARIRETWQRVLPLAQTVAMSFYQRLFQIDASVGPLFEGVDMADQGRRLVTALGTLVQSLDAPGELNILLEELGIRHAHYGVTPAQYDSFGAALLWALEQALDDAWTPETAAAWAAGYAMMAEAMRRGAAAA